MERKKKIQLHLWDSNPQPLAYMDKGTTTCAKGEPEVVGRGSGSYPVEVHCYAAFLSGRGQIVQYGRVRSTQTLVIHQWAGPSVIAKLSKIKNRFLILGTRSLGYKVAHAN